MKTFTIGGLYFMVQYSDPDFLFLVPTSLVFLGRNMITSEQHPDLWYFQDADSYCQSGSIKPSAGDIDERGILYALTADQLTQVVDCEGLSEVILECRNRRSKAGLPN
jgi:hypothetical protein